MRVFLDANILFSGAHPKSRMSAFLRILLREATCLTNAHAIEEARRNLALKSSSALEGLEFLSRRCEIIREMSIDIPVEIEQKDIPIMGGAIAGRATHLRPHSSTLVVLPYTPGVCILPACLPPTPNHINGST